ncbi:MAG: hypothetical protein ACRC42_04890 [Mycoplasma sp.]
MIEKNKYLEGEIYEISPIHGLFVKLKDGRLGIVSPLHVGDIIPSEYDTYFKKNIVYTFLKINPRINLTSNKYVPLSYKLCNPNVILNKRKVMPTISHFNNLRIKLQKDLIKFEKEQEK